MRATTAAIAVYAIQVSGAFYSTFSVMSGVWRCLINIEFTQISDRELRLTWIQQNIIKDIRLGINLKIVEVKLDRVILASDRGLAKMIISPALSYLGNRIPEIKEGIFKEDGNRIRVELGNIEKMKPLLEKIELKDILIEKDGIKLMAGFRIPKIKK